ncbi:MAG: nickel-dependent lactate racemase [Verrucomicrobia bacterium]|nr:MAG: nickel-dependent lactate racemase [Verrucomicrobiota bacterium]
MLMSETVRLEYGETGLDLDLEGVNATIIRPRFIPGLEDEVAAFVEAARRPIGGAPLRERIGAGDSVAVAIPDITRALPNERLLPWLFAELDHVPDGNITIVVGTGTHRGNTEAELRRMVGDSIYERYRIVNHDARDADTLVEVGRSRFGYPVSFNREYARADRRILLGFIEPHFMAGFSGGYKACFPGVAGLDAIMHYHSVANIADPHSTWGRFEGNPTQDHVRAAGSLLPVDFLLNVTLNVRKEITRFFCGDVIEAHEAGCAYARETTMAGVAQPFPIVITTNSGAPLDLNLYQTVKGMSAAHQITSEGGLILTAARCNDGFPEHGQFKQMLFRYGSAREALDAIGEPGFSEVDRWQVQLLALIVQKNRVGLYSELADEEVKRAYLTPIADLRSSLDEELDRIGRDARVAILPEGPLTIPYLEN